MAADFEMRKAASSILSSIGDFAKENPGMVAGMLGAGGIGALGGALYGDEDDDDRSTGARVMRRVKNALIGGALGVGSMAAIGHGINMLRGKSTTSTHNGTTPQQEMTNTAAAPVGGSVPADNTQHADAGDGGGFAGFVADAAGPVGWTAGGVITGVGSGKAVSKALGRGEAAAAERLLEATAIPGSTISGLAKYKGNKDAASLIKKDLHQFLNPKTGGGVSQLTATMPDSVDAAARGDFLAKHLSSTDAADFMAVNVDAAKEEFLKKHLTAGELKALSLTNDPVTKADRINKWLGGHNPSLVKEFANITEESLQDEFLKSRGLLDKFNKAVSSKGRAKWLAENLTPDHLAEYARVTDVNPILSEMKWRGNIGNKLKLHGLNNLRRVRKLGGPIAGSLVGAATTLGLPALINSINESMSKD